MNTGLLILSVQTKIPKIVYLKKEKDKVKFNKIFMKHFKHKRYSKDFQTKLMFIIKQIYVSINLRKF